MESFDGERLVVRAGHVLDGLDISESICVAGACLTVTCLDGSLFTVDTVPETLDRTNFGALKPGDGLNLERALRFGDRNGGHMVQGHVDAVGTLRSKERKGNSVEIEIAAPANIMRYVVEKGFIAVDGTSLTVIAAREKDFTVSVIPYTLDHTTLGVRSAGDRVNLEVDVVAKYVEKLAGPYTAGPAQTE